MAKPGPWIAPLAWVVARRATRTVTRRAIGRSRTPDRDLWTELFRDVSGDVVDHLLHAPIERLRAVTNVARPTGRRPHVRSHTREVAGMRVLELVPTGHARRGTILYLHGGGYVMGSPEGVSDLVALLVASTGRRAWLPDYRLAPEHRYPAAVDDCLAVYRALLEIDEPLALAGDSAGGALALATMLRARDSGLPQPAGAALISPWVDPAAETGSVVSNVDRDILSLRIGRHWFAQYTGQIDVRAPLWTDPYAAPLFADHRDLAPTLIQVGEAELLRDQDIELAVRMRAAGTEVTLELYPDMFHDFPLWTWTQHARTAIARLGRYLGQALDRASSLGHG